MTFLTPTALILGTIAIPILLMYMLKMRRKEVKVSSTFLWEMTIQDRQANSPWQRIKRNLLLILQLLILASLVFALARPAIKIPAVATGSLIVLLDGSASMQATDMEPNRFVAALTAIEDLIQGLAPNSGMTLIFVGNEPKILVSAERDKSTIVQTLRTLQPEQGTVDWEAALALAIGAASQISPNATIVIVSDGGLSVENIPTLPVEVSYIPIGNSNQNLALSALASRPTLNGVELFARVNNYGNSPKQAILSIFINDQLFAAHQVDIPQNDSQTFLFDGLPDSPAIFEARLSPTQTDEQLDSFNLDDASYAVYQPLAERTTLLVSEGNIFLEQFLAVYPGVTPFRTLPDEKGALQIPEEAFEIYVFDGAIPGELPPTDLLFINPPENPLFSVLGTSDQTANPTVFEHPLTQFVDWDNVNVSEAKQVELPDWAEALVSSETTPLVFAGQTGGRRVAVITFDLHNSDLPLQTTFPILMANLFGYLAPPQSFEANEILRPYEPLNILPKKNVQEVNITSPTGKTYSLPITENEVTFTETGDIGLYTIQNISEDTQSEEHFAVNLFSPKESTIQPAEGLQIGQTTISPPDETEPGQREIWRWLPVAALTVLGIDWWVYHRGKRFPSGIRQWIRKKVRESTRKYEKVREIRGGGGGASRKLF